MKGDHRFPTQVAGLMLGTAVKLWSASYSDYFSVSRIIYTLQIIFRVFGFFGSRAVFVVTFSGIFVVPKEEKDTNTRIITAERN